MHQRVLWPRTRTQRMTYTPNNTNSKLFSLTGRMNPLCDPMHYNSEQLHDLRRKEYLKTKQIIQYMSLVILMDVSYASVFHTTKRQRMAVDWLGCNLILWFFPLICDSYVATCDFACFSHATSSLSIVSSNTLHSSVQAETLTCCFTWTFRSSAAASIRKGKKEPKNPPKIGSSLLPLPAGNKVVILFPYSDIHTGHYSQCLQKVSYLEGNNTLIMRHSL